MHQGFVLFLTVVQLANVDASASCSLKSAQQDSTYKDGDILIGGILQRFTYNSKDIWQDTTKPRTIWHCTMPTMHLFEQFASFVYAIEEINRNPDILPNHTLGYQIFDSCSSVMKSLHSAMSILSNRREPIPNYRCSKKGRFVGIVGDLSSETSHAIAQLVGMYRFPQVSFGALDPKFSNKLRFPSFYRTVPSELPYFAGIVHLLMHFGWTWVGCLVSEDDSGEQALKEIRKAVALSGGCVEFEYMIPTEFNVYQAWKISMLFQTLRKSTAQVCIIYSSSASAERIFFFNEWLSLKHRVWIGSPTMSFLNTRNMQIFNGSLLFSIKKENIVGLQDFLCDITPSKFPNDSVVAYLWPTPLYQQVPSNGHSLCSAKNNFQSLDISKNRFAYTVYTAVYAFVHSLHAMLSSDPGPRNTGADRGINEEDAPWRLNALLKKTHFTTPGGEEVYFGDKGEPPAKFVILNNINYSPGNRAVNEVGSFDSSAPSGHQFFMNSSIVVWHSLGNNITKVTVICVDMHCTPVNVIASNCTAVKVQLSM